MARFRQQTELDFRDALKFLVKEALMSEGPRSTNGITVSAVAKKAGRARTQIAHKNGAYQHIRRLIFRVNRRIAYCKNEKISSKNSPSDIGNRLEFANASLRKRINELESEVAMYAKLLAEADLQLQQFNRQTEREQFDIDRKKRRSSGRRMKDA